MRSCYVLVSSVLILCLAIRCSFATDATLVSGSTGTAIVESCITKIQNSGIFNEDFNFLRNLAYVETKDGTEMDARDTGGIWKVTLETFSSIENTSYDVSSYYGSILSHFNIQWTSVTYDNLAIPLYSALARRLHIAHLESVIAVASDTLQQGVLWAIQLTSTGETATYYETLVNSITTGCTKPKRDVVFLVDSSISSGDPYLTSAKTVVSNIVKMLKIDVNRNETVVGIAQFSNFVQELSYLNGSSSESDILTIISGAELLSGVRLTGLAAGNAISGFYSVTNGAKGWSSGTAQVLCIFTAGDSLDSTQNVAAAASSAGVSIISVGMTAEVTESLLTSMSTESSRVFHTSNFTSLTALEFAVTRQICAEKVTVPPGSNEISGVINPTESSSLTLSVPSTGINSKVRTSVGTMAIYYSATIEDPTSAYHEYSLAVDNPNQEVSLQYVPTSEELSRSVVSVNLYLTLVCTSDVAAHFTITIEEPDESVTLVLNITTNTTISTTPSSGSETKGLTDGEIAGIVFSCLIVFCAVLVAVVYYRFGNSDGRKPLSMHKDKLDRPMDSSKDTENDETDPDVRTSCNEEGLIATSNIDGTAEIGTEEAQQKRLEVNVRERMRSAIRRRDISDLNDAAEDFLALKLEDFTGDFVTAQRMIAVHQCKQGIINAINMKNIKILEKAIFKGKRMEYDMELKMELVNAEILLQDLKKIDNLLRRLKRALDGADLATVEAVTAELRVLKGCDQSTVERMLMAFQYREDIEEAMERRDINGINESMARIMEKGLERELGAEMRQARKLLKDLRVIENARKDVLGLKQSCVSEIKGYGTPPPGVHEVMMTVYILLGYHPTQLQTWTDIQVLMGKTGREGLRRMIGEMEITGVDVMHLRMAKSLLDNFDLRSIRDISEALGVFYTFALAVIKEVGNFLPEGDQESGVFGDVYDCGSMGLTPLIRR